ncbi:PAAR domain-containing protein [Burkholderia stagnalis]|uniref:PAAR domain-containing protein n=1 Tax=Burkholderia stagnalis TaxID=1503054 RepID=UPI000ADEE72F|nr:PAAR domain-containing protein [Burkholderia stagnalis]
MDGLLAAARFGDPVAHTASKGWMIAGLIAGAVIGAAAVVLTGGAALTVFAAMAAGAAAGGGLGEVLGTMSWAPRHVTGSLIRGSPNVFINSRPAMRAQLSLGVCSDHAGPPQIVGQGSSTVFINDQPASRKEDKLMCSAVISDGSPNVFIGGATVGEVNPEIPAWVNWTMLGVGVAAAAILAGPLVAVLGTVGGIAGGELGSWLGGKAFGEGSDGQKWSMLGGSLLGGYAGAKMARAPLIAGEAPATDPIAVRRAANEQLRNSPKFDEDMAKVGVDRAQIDAMFAKECPLGFKSPEQFTEFKTGLNDALKRAGLDDAEIGMKGTSTTFYSENPGKPLGHHWDADPVNPGDYDLNITSDKMVSKMQDLGISPSEKYGVFKTRDIQETFPELDEFRSGWSKELGRDVNFVGYPKATPRDVTEYVLRSPE